MYLQQLPENVKNTFLAKIKFLKNKQKSENVFLKKQTSAPCQKCTMLTSLDDYNLLQTHRVI